MIPAWLLTAAAAAIAAGSFAGGWQVNGWRHAANERDRMAAEVQAQADQRKRIDRAAEKYLTEKDKEDAQQQAEVREVVRVVTKPVYRDVCLDDDGLQLLQSAAARANARRNLAPAVPASVPTD